MNYKKNILIFFILFFVFVFSFGAQAKITDWGTKLNLGAKNTDIYQVSEENNKSAEIIAKYAGSIMAFGAFLGAVLIMQLIIAGYEWMTAQGNEEKIEKAQKRIMYATIAIIILAGLYAVASFFISRLGGVTGYKVGG